MSQLRFLDRQLLSDRTSELRVVRDEHAVISAREDAGCERLILVGHSKDAAGLVRRAQDFHVEVARHIEAAISSPANLQNGERHAVRVDHRDRRFIAPVTLRRICISLELTPNSFAASSTLIRLYAI